MKPAKSVLTLAAILAFGSYSATAQSSVHAKDLKGVWHMTFDLADEAESSTEEVVLGAVEGLLNSIDIRFEFLPDYRLKVMADVFGDEAVEYSEWLVNERRELILGDSEHFDSENTVWLFEDGRLVGYEYQDGERVRSSDGVYLQLKS